jgi:hypothetical protein
MVSEVWDHCEKIKSNGKIISDVCNHCKKVLSVSKGSTNSLKGHLFRKHDILISTKNGNSSKDENAEKEMSLDEIISRLMAEDGISANAIRH